MTSICCASIHGAGHGGYPALRLFLPLALEPYFLSPIWTERRPVESLNTCPEQPCPRRPLLDFDYGGIIQLSLCLCRSAAPTPLLLRVDRVPCHRPFLAPVEPIKERHIFGVKREVVKLRVRLYAGRRRRLR